MAETIMKSFPDCPNGCVDGKIYNPYSHTYAECDYCKQKRLELVRNSTAGQTDVNIDEMLHIPKGIVGVGFNMKNLIDPSATNITKESLETVETQLKGLFETVSGGQLPDHSYLINLGSKANVLNFLVPLIRRAYISSLSIAPYLNHYELGLIYQRSLDRCFDKGAIEGFTCTYSDLLKYDLACVRLLANAEKLDILQVKGFLQARAERGNATIITTDVWTNDTASFFGEMQSYSICELVAVKTTSFEKKAERSSGGLLSQVL